MAWVRIDDQAPRNAKMLKAGPAACWLWVCGIAHCQSQLTDGFISLDVLPMIGVAGVTRCKRLADTLIDAGLFERAEGGYQVHGYLDHNPSRAQVLAKRAEDAERKRSGEERRTEDRRIPRGIHAESRAPRAGVPSHPIPSVDPSDTAARSKRPVFTGQRLTVHEWMLDDCTKTLGPYAPDFDLHEWFFALDEQAIRANLVIPKRDGGAWLQAQLVAEAQRRGLPLTLARATLGKPQTSYQPRTYDEWTCPHPEPCNHPTRCRQLVELEKAKALA